MSSGMFGYVNLLKTAADASWQREELLTNNIANADTPNYKRQDLEFTSYLNSAIQSTGSSADTLTKKVNQMDLSKVAARTYTDHGEVSYRLDGNNVDMSTENVELAAEQINYNALVDSINNEFTRMRSVIK